MYVFLFCKAGSFRIRMSRTFGAHKNRTIFFCVFFLGSSFLYIQH